ncbi:MAG: type I secretion system permease/ATPase, partial [Campylobacter sp.]|nr:type I secretion system permease/ATPase [Campylobacter sp.]
MPNTLPKHTALNSLQICANFAHFSLDLGAIKNKFALNESEPSPEELVRIARDNDFKAKIKPLDPQMLVKYAPPFIALKKESGTYFTILKFDFANQKAIIYDGGADVREISLNELKEISTDKVIILAHKTFNKGVKFGFGWFYNRMLSYKRIVGEVMLASFIMQLFGL